MLVMTYVLPVHEVPGGEHICVEPSEQIVNPGPQDTLQFQASGSTHEFKVSQYLNISSNECSLFTSIYKVVIYLCLFVCPIITHEPLYQFVSSFDWGTKENHGNVLRLVLRF